MFLLRVGGIIAHVALRRKGEAGCNLFLFRGSASIFVANRQKGKLEENV
jgi:hypothetical protein